MVTDARRGKSLFYFLSSTKLFDRRLVERARMISCYRERALHPISSMIQAICTYVGRWFSILFAATRFLEVFFAVQLPPAFIFHENEISRVKEKSKCKEFVHRSMIFIYLRGDTILERFTKFAIAELLYFQPLHFPWKRDFPTGRAYGALHENQNGTRRIKDRWKHEETFEKVTIERS